MAIEAGLRLEEFWQLSMREFNLVLVAHARTELRNERRAWSIARWQTWVMVNKELKPQDQIPLHKLLPLPGDEEVVTQKNLTGPELKNLIQRFGKPAEA